MKRINIHTNLLAILLLSSLILASCGKDGGLTDPDPENPDKPGNTVDADKLGEYLVLANAQKITGDLLSAAGKVTGNLSSVADNQLKINFPDSIFVMKGFPYGARVAVLHEDRFDITGFYVGVPGSSFYYDVPAVEAEARDSIDVFYINIEIPESDNVGYPFSIPIKILPHDSNGTPLDEFSEVITSEDPGQSTACPITTPAGETPEPFHWEWSYTVTDLTEYGGEVIYDAPELAKLSAYQTGGCCNEDGSSSTVANDPYCFEKFSDTGAPNPRWRSIDVETYFTWLFDNLWFYEDGTFRQVDASIQTNYRPSLSNFCTLEPAYDEQLSQHNKTGTHDFAPGADYLNIAYDPTDPPVFGKTIQSGNIQYTCHLLSFEYNREAKITVLYSKYLLIHGAYRNWWD